MLPAAGLLLTERLYIGIKINSLTDESYSEYATNDNGAIDIDIIDGRNQGFIVRCNGVTVTSTNGKNISIGGFNGGIDSDRNASAETVHLDYTLTVYDKAYKITNECVLTIGYNGSGSWITYNGVQYTAGQSFHFLNHH
jgi:uncharacterized protein involved in outer membrane biogenesis